jgi:cysteine desulfurase
MIYADANGSLPLLPEVRDYLATRIPSQLWGNPNAIHSLGSQIKAGMDKCREIVGDILGANPTQVIWNSGSSESCSTVLQHVLLPMKTGKTIIYSSPIEHAAIGAALEHYKNVWGYELRYIPVSVDGLVDEYWLASELAGNDKRVALVTVMAVNNETGVIQPWEKIRDLSKKYQVPFFCDTTQLIGRMPFHFNESGLDWAMASGHKLGALPGSGFLLARDPGALKPLVWGGGQESGLRGGTQNYLGVETLAVALQTLPAKLARIPQLNAWRKNLEAGLPSGTVVIGAKHERLPGTMLIGCPGVHGQGVQIELESQDIFVTTSAACSDNEPATSKVLRAMKIDDILGRSVIRASLSLSASESDYLTLLSSLKTAYAKLNRIKAY